MKRVLSGIQPSGQLHLGNYFGMMSRMIHYQEENDLFCFIVNYHAMTSMQDGASLKENTMSAAMDFLSLGLDPEKSTFWVQSDIPQVAELMWILSVVTSVGLMERGTSYKDKLAKGLKANMGLFSYPILMAADILLFGGEIVPVGKDQKQHLEMTRDIAVRFNQTFGDVLIVPELDIDKDTQLVPGLDGQKMSKSYNNTIPIFGSEKVIQKKVMSIVTDSSGVNEVKNTNCTLFKIFCLFLDENGKLELADKFQTPGTGYGEIKKELFSTIMKHFKLFRQKRDYYEQHQDQVHDILKQGAEKASAVAETFLTPVRDVTGLNYKA
ncbi:MAG TPA: tryptophan--tRNA ligase [Candidatus Marinimicrobia bacterium]|nr:tryptophan--tRNA ligase [Candidatus Neomarinimicrobiota bacterium]HIB60860.1 tryptophan--tRNA ligase [Candidatus Neomarinimicrobiota bacterium]